MEYGFNQFTTIMKQDNLNRHCGDTYDGDLDCAFCDGRMLCYPQDLESYMVGTKCFKCRSVIIEIIDLKLEYHNQQRKDLGEPIVQQLTNVCDIEKRHKIWQYRVGGEKYLEAKKEIYN